MEQNALPARLLAGTVLAFQPVPQQRRRADGWTPATQQCFIRALEAMGSVGQAARPSVWVAAPPVAAQPPGGGELCAGMRSGDSMGRMRRFDDSMDRASNGITTVRVLRGNAIDVSGGADTDIVHSALREDAAPLKATKDSF